ncbi:MAG: sugar ABC transporter permease [Mesorhizobium amorphae]|nr:MAG: sugar ABC transporter permease [Mesorhizobium amorphae]
MSTAELSARAAGPAPRQAAFNDDRLWRWTTFSPALALMLLLSVLPLVNLFATSFQDVTWAGGQAVRESVGLAHYRALPTDPLFRAGLWNTLIFAIVAVAGQMVLGLFLAVLCSKITRGKVFYRAVFILPILIPGIVIGAIWKLMLNFDFGLVNGGLSLLGIPPHDWLGASETALLSVILVDIWHWTPFCFLLCLAGIEGLPQDVSEASRIDGASAWQEFRFITFPLLIPTLIVTFAFRLVLAFKVFDEVFLLTGGGPGTATEVVSFTLYQRFFTEDRVGYGSAMSVAVIFFVSLLLVIAMASQRRSAAAA